jgi:DMSO/TMAO reductase YedYZ molybdopterin-dependent catalytic subunit
MPKGFVSRGFQGRRVQSDDQGRIPPGQHETADFPVLTAGPTPRTELKGWTFEINGLVTKPVRWTWDEFRRLKSQSYTVDIHCVTK